MPKTKISEYSATNSSNTDIEGINIDEGCAPSGINNAIRELIAAIISGNINSSGTNTFSGSNVMSFSGGSSASPSIYFASDTNTGIFSPAADTIAFTEGGVESMRINSSGNVGVGTTSPTGYRLNAVAAFASGVGGAYIEAGEFNQPVMVLNHTNGSVSANLFQVQKSGTGVLTLDSSGRLITVQIILLGRLVLLTNQEQLTALKSMPIGVMARLFLRQQAQNAPVSTPAVMWGLVRVVLVIVLMLADLMQQHELTPQLLVEILHFVS